MAIRVDPVDVDMATFLDESEGDVESTGDNQARPAHGNVEARRLRKLLLEFATEAERIKGEIYGAAAVADRWNKKLVMSNDLVLMEMHEDGPATDITNMVNMANTTGMDAKEALDASRHTCAKCGYAAKGFSDVILKDVTASGHAYWCRQCYSDSCRGDVDDDRAWRNAEGDDMELPYNQFKKDKGCNEGMGPHHVEGHAENSPRQPRQKVLR